MELYLLKFSGCLVVFWVVYVLLLEKQKMHQFKRFYLLGAFIVSLIIPLLTITYYVEPVMDFGVSNSNIIIDPSTFTTNFTPATEVPPIDYLPIVLWSIYALGVALFSIRFITSLLTLYKRILKNETLKQHPFIYVLMQHYHVPHSFFNYIFFSKSKYETGAIPREVILHEETHAKQLHSLDILVVELLQIVFWFHPLVYLLKHHIKLNHEFLADQAVLEHGTDAKNYQHILLQFSSSNHNNVLSSAINYSSFKKRFTVMKTQTSKRKIWASIALLLPIAAVLFYSFSTKEYVEKTPDAETAQTQFSQSEINESKASEKLMAEYNAFMQSYKETNVIRLNKYDRAIIIYDNVMSDKQRSSVEKYPERLLPESNLSKVTPKQPTKAQFEAFKNSKDYAIWIDGKHISNSKLSNYALSDFVHVIGSKVYENARSKKFPQPNQYSLYTKEGFQKTYLNAQVDKYKSSLLEYSRATELFLNGFLEDNSELKILKTKADKIYSTLSKSDIFSNALNPTPPIPIVRNNTETSNTTETGFIIINNVLHFYVIKNNKRHYYNSKGFETDSSGKQISKTQINASDVVKDQYITKVYKDNKVVVTFKDNWDDAEKEKNLGQTSDLVLHQDTLTDYQIKYLEYIKLQDAEPHYINKSKSDKEKMEALFSDLGGIYFRLSKVDASKVQRPTAPVRPYVKITLNGKTYYKKSSELTSEERATLPTAPLPAKNYIPSVKQVADYNAWAKELTAKVNAAEKDSKNNDYPIIKKKDLDRYQNIYNRMTEKQRSNSEPFPKSIPPMPPKPPTPSTNQDVPTPKQVANYNAWAREFKQNTTNLTEKEKVEGYPVMDQRKFNYYNSIYKKLSGEQLKTAESFPEAVLAPPPPPPPYHKGKVSEDMMNSYNKWIAELKNLDGTYNMVTKEGYNYFISIYNNMTDEQKEVSKLPPPPPPTAPTKTKSKSKSKGGPNSSTIVINQSIPSKNNEDCLELPKAFITTNDKTLDISCIDEHPNNSIEIFNKWGKRIFKKENYTNDWDGTVDKDYAAEGTNKPIASTYYYVFSSTKLKEPKVGPILINMLKADGVTIEKMTGSENPKNVNSDDCFTDIKNFDLATDKTLKINCIEDYATNKLQIFDRWGKVIFSKDNYKNDWNGTVSSEHTKADNSKMQTGTYFYVVKVEGVKKDKTGWIYVENNDK